MFLNIYKEATAHIKGRKAFPNINGIVTFRETKNGVMLTSKIHGLPGSQSHCTRKIFRFSHS